MSHQPIDSDLLSQLVSSVLLLLKKEGFTSSDDPTLKPEFCCPFDGSSRTAKISELLASRPRGTIRLEGKTISFVGGDERLDRLDPGPEPGDLDIAYYFGVSLVVLGGLISVIASSPRDRFGWICCFLGVWTMFFSWYRDRDLDARHATWREKRDQANTHWLCDPCGEIFRPEDKLVAPEADLLDEVSGNVQILRRGN